MRASYRLPALNLFQGRLAPPLNGGGGRGGYLVGYRQAAPNLGPCSLLPPNIQTSHRALLKGVQRTAVWSRKKEAQQWGSQSNGGIGNNT